ncbi:hypothetical protein [Bremerella alba]|uniref:Uncharacterized protein n=1 Tax=Bremerella alba TaxID=980252 RepID=A0A7V8V718_9BACT|nr:hypothetical protein [Bremerella alba]MBA2116159.1 hypothetical protein [Bremerella alba]
MSMSKMHLPHQSVNIRWFSIVLILFSIGGCSAESPVDDGDAGVFEETEDDKRVGQTRKANEHSNLTNLKLNRIGSGSGITPEQITAAAKNTDVNFTQLKDIRSKFWKTKPDDSEYESLRKIYAEALLEKDIQILHAGIATGSDGFLSKVVRVSLDGGVSEIARPALSRWVDGIRKHMGIREKQRYQMLENINAYDRIRFNKALAATQHLAQQYETMRDWGEYVAAGRHEDFYPTPESYVAFVLLTDGEGVSQEQAQAKYHDFARMIGEEIVLVASQKQRLHPKDRYGFQEGSKMKLMYDLMQEISRASDVGFILNNFRMLARADDRWAEAVSDYQEMMQLIDSEVALKAASHVRQRSDASLELFLREIRQHSDKYCFLAVIARSHGMQWKEAQNQYKELCKIYGEATVLRVANHVRTAKVVHGQYGSEYIEDPSQLINGEGPDKIALVTREEGMLTLLKLEPRKELPTEKENKPQTAILDTLSPDNRLSTASLPVNVLDSGLAAHQGGVAVGLSGIKPGQVLGFTVGKSTDKVVVFEVGKTEEPVSISNSDLLASPVALDMSERFVIVGKRHAWLGDPKTGRGPRINAGEAYVFDRNTGKLVTKLRLPNSLIRRNLGFGYAVVTYGDYAAVGAPWGRGKFEDEGEVHLLDATNGTYFTKIGMPRQYQGSHRFGSGLASDGKTLMVLATGEGEYAEREPGVFLFKAKHATFITKLEIPKDDSLQKSFGQSMAVSGKWAVVGYPTHEEGGSALVYDSTSGTLLATLKNSTIDTNPNEQPPLGKSDLVSLIPQKGIHDNHFGKSLAISGQTLVVASDKALHVYDVATSTAQYVIPINDSMKSKGFRIQHVSLDGNIIAASLSNGTGGRWSHHVINTDEFRID